MLDLDAAAGATRPGSVPLVWQQFASATLPSVAQVAMMENWALVPADIAAKVPDPFGDPHFVLLPDQDATSTQPFARPYIIDGSDPLGAIVPGLINVRNVPVRP